jgi:hypothetical protein
MKTDDAKNFEDAIREISGNDADGQMALLLLAVGAHLHAYSMDREGDDLECECYLQIATSAMAKLINKKDN